MRLSALPLLPLLLSAACAQLPEESGSFRNFMGGVEPACAYDNWISHISEGIARPGYNAYAPNSLDPQTTGFGSFEVLQDNAHGNAVLQLFADLADSLLQDHGEGALLRLQQEPSVDYELLLFHDSETGRDLYVLRELLDMSYTDFNNDGAADDVHGGFHHGWGIFVFAPGAPRAHWVLEAPHPNDDYPTPYLATNLFLDEGAGLLMVSGAGREVAYTGNPGSYTNSASLSDPSRNCLTPFAVIHERAINHWRGLGMMERTLQIHTYDDVAHRDLKSAVVSGGRNQRLNLPPIYDTGNGPCGLLNNLHQPAIAASSMGFAHSAVNLVDYVATQSLNTIRVDGGIAGNEYVLGISPDLWGFPNSCQEADSHPAGYPDCHADENWVHVEMDELPAIGHSRGSAFWYQSTSGLEPAWSNFARPLQYFAPVYDGLAEAEDSLAAGAPTPAPTNPTGLSVAGVDIHALLLNWTPLWSSHFDTYQVLVDPAGVITPNAQQLDASDFSALCWAPLNAIWIDGLDYQQSYAVALRGVDLEGRVSALSNVVTGTPDDVFPPLFIPRYPGNHGRYWVPPGGGPVTLRVRDEDHLVDLSSLAVRVDQNLNGGYDLNEPWQNLGLTGSSADTTVTVTVPATGTGIRHLEFRAHDDQHEILGCSGADDECGIGDDWHLGVDGQAPAAFSGLELTALTSAGGLTLHWPAQNPDSTFLTYELALAPFPFADFAQAAVRYTRTQFSNLGQPASTGLTLPAQPWLGDSLWLAARTLDAAGNAGAPSPALVFLYFSTAWCAIDLQVGVQLPSINLSWTTQCTVSGLVPSGWWLHALDEPWQPLDEGTRLLHATQPSAALAYLDWMPDHCFRVVAEFEPVPFQAASVEATVPPPVPPRLRPALRLRAWLPEAGPLREDTR
jgi:hypothetical protein